MNFSTTSTNYDPNENTKKLSSNLKNKALYQVIKDIEENVVIPLDSVEIS